MKIYTKIRIDIKTGDVLEEEFFEHDGLVALCDGGPADNDAGPGNDFGGFDSSVDMGEAASAAAAAGMGGMTGTSDWGGYVPSARGIEGLQLSKETIDGLLAKQVGAIKGDAKTGAKIGVFAGPLGVVVGAAIGALVGAIRSGYTASSPATSAAVANAISQKDPSIPKDVVNALAQKVVTEKSPEAMDGNSSEQIINAMTARAEGIMNLQQSVLESINKVATPGLDKAAIAQFIADRVSQGQSPDQILNALKTDRNSPAPAGLDGVKSWFNAQYPTWSSVAAEGAASTPPGAGATPIDQQIQGMLSAAQPDTTRFYAALDEFKNINTDVQFIHDISELENVKLSDEEKQFLETMRSNATTNLTNTVNESTINLAETEIARLVDRGVLQGNIGSETISKIYEKAGKVIGEQSRNIESDVANLGFQTLEQKKANQMNLWGQELTANIANVGAQTEKWKGVGMLEASGLQQQQTWNQNLIGALTTMRGQDTSYAAAKLGAETNLNMAGQEMDAWRTAQDKQMWGNIGSALINAWA